MTSTKSKEHPSTDPPGGPDHAARRFSLWEEDFAVDFDSAGNFAKGGSIYLKEF